MESKYPLVSTQKIVSALSRAGFSFKSQKGSHAKYTNGSTICTVPMHGEVQRGTLHSILHQADISIDEFLELLK
jgi:predicted RNA binding protein YcfA (HicA-like mRNA interferase family)